MCIHKCVHALGTQAAPAKIDPACKDSGAEKTHRESTLNSQIRWTLIIIICIIWFQGRCGIVYISSSHLLCQKTVNVRARRSSIAQLYDRYTNSESAHLKWVFDKSECMAECACYMNHILKKEGGETWKEWRNRLTLAHLIFHFSWINQTWFNREELYS